LSLEPALPFEFLVKGTALSQQASSSSKEAWKAEIRLAAKVALPEDYWLLTEPLAVTIFIFPNAKLPGDVDNRAKPILDAMSRCVYIDDGLVERIVVQAFEPESIFPFDRPSEPLAAAMAADGPIVYVRITNDLHEELS
jgi:hypothetical protein